MTHDEDQGVHSEHVVEISNESSATRVARRRSFATLSVAVCLALAGAVTAFAFVRDQLESAADKRRDAAQREQLLDGWTTLGAVAAAQRSADEMRAPATQPVAPSATPAPAENVIIVNSPAPAATSQSVQPPPPSASVRAATAAPALTRATNGSPSPSTIAAPVGVPAPASAPDQTPAAIPASPPPGSPDTVLSPVTYPASQACGLSTCNVDSVCCNVSCGICTAPGGSCSQTQCG